jgi:hypothetical protein
VIDDIIGQERPEQRAVMSFERGQAGTRRPLGVSLIRHGSLLQAVGSLEGYILASNRPRPPQIFKVENCLSF